MSRLPVRPLAGALISTLVLVLTSLIGSAVAPAQATPVSPTRAAIELDTNLTLVMPRCDGCVVTLASDDGLETPYFSLPATVVEGMVAFTLPSARTAGMSVKVQPPWAGAPTYVAWRYNGKSIGSNVNFKAAKGKVRASGCWAGTVNEAVTLTIKVRQVSRRGQATAIAWAPVTESFLPPMQRSRGGVLASDSGLTCKTMR